MVPKIKFIEVLLSKHNENTSNEQHPVGRWTPEAGFRFAEGKASAVFIGLNAPDTIKGIPCSPPIDETPAEVGFSILRKERMKGLFVEWALYMECIRQTAVAISYP